MTKSQIEKLTLDVVATYFRKYLPQQPSGIFISVAKVKVSPDLTMLNVYFDLISTSETDLETILKSVFETHHWPLKRYMSTHLRHRLRRVPSTLHFSLHKDTVWP